MGAVFVVFLSVLVFGDSGDRKDSVSRFKTRKVFAEFLMNSVGAVLETALKPVDWTSERVVRAVWNARESQLKEMVEACADCLACQQGELIQYEKARLGLVVLSSANGEDKYLYCPEHRGLVQKYNWAQKRG